MINEGLSDYYSISRTGPGEYEIVHDAKSSTMIAVENGHIIMLEGYVPYEILIEALLFLGAED